MEDLIMEDSNVRNSITELREKYAQENSILYLPFRSKEDLQSTTDNTYWTSFTSEKQHIIWPKRYEIM